MSAYLLHKREFRGVSGSLLKSTNLICISISYTLLNKYGLGVSIHSFVSSKSAQVHYGSLLLFVALSMYTVYFSRATCLLALSFALISLYVSLRTCIVLKPFILLALFYTSFVYIGKHLWVKVTHRLLSLIAVLFMIANYYNYSVFFMQTHRLIASQAFSGGMPGLISWWREQHILRWQGMWLSKPRYNFSQYLDVSSARNLAFRSGVSAFLK